MSQELMNSLATYAPIILMGIIFYFMLYRPQKKEQQKRRELLDGLKKGDRVVTIGGLHGTIMGLNDKIVNLRIADRVEVTVSRASIHAQQNDNK
ncbi:MAG: preprotein translocase subunit YajC [Pelosinus sp.]|nr:preprotein translocase subunit YajC [Pelosinus sp.]